MEDFKDIFPDTMMFTFRYMGRSHTVSLYEAWEAIFIGSFEEKLFDLNDKIQTFRDAKNSGRNPYIGVVEAHYPTVDDRFLENAQIFANQFWRLVDEDLFTGIHSARDLVYRWHVYLMKKGFII